MASVVEVTVRLEHPAELGPGSAKETADFFFKVAEEAFNQSPYTNFRVCQEMGYRLVPKEEW